MNKEHVKKSWKHKLHEVIYEADTFGGKFFDISLLVLILMSIVLVMLESVSSIDEKYHETLYIAEWIVTFLFTIEYVLRIISIKKPFKIL